MVTPLLEREAELDQLGRLLEKIGRDGGRVVLVRGTAGIGKTALVDHFLDGLDQRVQIARGGCEDFSTPQPLGPIWELRDILSGLAAPLHDGNRRTVSEALLSAMSSRLRPTVVVIEDLQWGDQATFDVIRYVGRRIARAHGLLVLTYRDGEVDTNHPLRTVVGDLPPERITRFTLSPLTARAVADLIYGTGLDTDQVMDLTGGNPLFVTEVSSWGLDEVPPSVRDLVLARYARASHAARRLLDFVSIMPAGAGRGLIAALVEPGPADETECRNLLQIDDAEFRFRHEIARRAIESALEPNRRRTLNQQVLDALGPDADSSVASHHAVQAGNVDAVLRWAPIAARVAQQRSANREAIAHFDRLAAHADRLESGELARILEDRARSEYYLGHAATGTVSRAISLHRALGASADLARALSFVIRLDIEHGRFGAAEDHAREAIGILEPLGPSPELAWALCQLALVELLQGHAARARDLADRAIVMADEVGDQRSSIDAMITKAGLLLGRQPLEAFRILEDCRARAERDGLSYEECRALINMAMNADFTLTSAHAADLIERARETAHRHEITIVEIGAGVLACRNRLLSGDWLAAGEEALALQTRGELPSSSRQTIESVLATIAARGGRPDAKDRAAAAYAAAAETGQPQHLVQATEAAAEVAWLTGNTDPELRTRVSNGYAQAVALHFPWSTGMIGMWRWLSGDLEALPEWAAAPYRLVTTGAPARAAELFREKGWPYEQAIALMTGDERLKLDALAMFEHLGATVPAERLRRELKDAGVKVPGRRAKATRDHAVGLTARQAEVLDLLAEGHTSPQIADILFVSPRTVESHVAAILLKLDAPDRRAAVARARDLGILEHASR
jgi:DNA-binding CsgD family transcriptional regulator/tetratricopeptide (TPR) repeat protein